MRGILVETLEGRNLLIGVESTYTIGAVKDKLTTVDGEDRRRRRLRYMSRVLRDSETIGGAGIYARLIGYPELDEVVTEMDGGCIIGPCRRIMRALLRAVG